MPHDDIGIVQAKSKVTAHGTCILVVAGGICKYLWRRSSLPLFFFLTSILPAPVLLSNLNNSIGEEPVPPLHHTIKSLCEIFSLLIFCVLTSPQMNSNKLSTAKLEIEICSFSLYYSRDIQLRKFGAGGLVSANPLPPRLSQVDKSASNVPQPLFSLPLLSLSILLCFLSQE